MELVKLHANHPRNGKHPEGRVKDDQASASRIGWQNDAFPTRERLAETLGILYAADIIQKRRPRCYYHVSKNDHIHAVVMRCSLDEFMTCRVSALPGPSCWGPKGSQSVAYQAGEIQLRGYFSRRLSFLIFSSGFSPCHFSEKLCIGLQR